MRKLISNLMLSVAVVISAASFSAPAVADDVKMVGVITKIKLWPADEGAPPLTLPPKAEA